MSKDISNKAQHDCQNGYVSEHHSSEPSDSDIEILKRLYLPKSQANYPPSEESIEHANNLNDSKHNTLL